MDASFVYTNLVEVLTSAVDSLLNGFVFDGYEALSNALAMPMVGLFTLYVILMGFSMAFGWSNFSAAEFASVILKFSVISTVVLNWSFVSEYFFNLLNSSIDEISSALISHEKMHLPFVGDLDSGIQQALTQFTKLGSLVFDTGGLSNLGGFFDGMVIWLVGYIFTGIALFEIILSKVMLALLFVFTPLMALFCLFDPFKPLCGRWLGLILGFALLQLFVQAMTAFGMGLTALWVTAHETASSGLAIGSYGTLPIIILGIICIGLVHKAGQLGLHIGREVGLGASKAISGASSASQRSLESESSASSASSSFGSGSSSNSNSSSGSGRYTPDHSDLNKPEIKRW